MANNQNKSKLNNFLDKNSKKNKHTGYKLGFLGFITILFYCLTIIIGIVWASVGYVWISGGFEEEKIYPNSLYFEYADLAFEDTSLDENGNAKRDDCLRITGINEKVKKNIIDSANEKDKENLEKNISIDRKFIVRCYPSDANILDVTLTSSDPTIAQVPKNVKIGQEVEITPMQYNGVNKGGFIQITASTKNAIYSQEPLKVLVDVPVTNFNLSLSKEFSSEVIKPIIPDTEENGGETIQNSCLTPEQALALEGETLYYMYEGEETNILSNIFPTNALNPTINCSNDFLNYKKSNKRIEFFLEDPLLNNNSVILDSVNGNFKGLKAGLYKVNAKVFKTFDDEIFVDDYKFDFEFDTVIPENKLVGRYEYSCIYIEVKPIVLEKITVNKSPRSIDLFKTMIISTDMLEVTLESNKNETEYFKNEIKNLELTSSAPSVISVEKTENKGEWKLTALKEYNGAQVILNLKHPDYEIVCEIPIEINIIDVENFVLEGNSKSSSSIDFNDTVEINIHKKNDVIIEKDKYNPCWNYKDFIHFNTLATYQHYRLFAVNYEITTLKNVEDTPNQDVILLGDEFKGFGREIKSLEQVQALSRGRIFVVAYIIKTDINGNPIDINGDLILSNEQNYVKVAQSNTIEIIVKELLRSMNAKINVQVNETEENSEIDIEEQKIVLANGEKIEINLLPNSNGALLDAIEYDLLYIGYNNKDILYCDISNNLLENITCFNISNNMLIIKFDFGNIDQIDSVEKIITLKIKKPDSSIESLKGFQFKIMNIPVESIKINTNGKSINEGGKEYDIYGTITNIEPSENNHHTSLDVQWGQVVKNIMQEFKLLKPTFVPAKIDFGLEKVIVPIPLKVTNTSYDYTAEQKSKNGKTVLKVNQDGTLDVFDISEPIELTLKSNANEKVYDIITLNFDLKYTFNWTLSPNQNSVTMTELKNGCPLESRDLQLVITPKQNGDFESGIQYKVKANEMKFEVQKDSKSFVSVETGKLNEYDGQYLKLNSSAMKEDSFEIVASVKTLNGLLITHTYKFFVIDK